MILPPAIPVAFGEDPCRAPVLCQFAPRDDLHSNVDEVSGVTLLGWGFAKLNVTSYKTMVFYTYDCNLSNFLEYKCTHVTLFVQPRKSGLGCFGRVNDDVRCNLLYVLLLLRQM